MQTLTPMMQQYLQIKKKYPGYLLMFRLGDFYEFFMEDAKIASKVLNITLTSRPVAKRKRIPMAGIPFHASKTYLKKLLSEGYKVAVCEQTSEPGKAKIVEREVVRIITPGTYIEEELEEDSNQYVFTYKISKEKLGFAFADLSTGEFFAGEENEPQKMLKELIEKLPIKEIVVENEKELEPIKEIIKLKNITISFYSADDVFSSEEYLKDFFQVKTLKSFNLEEKESAIDSASFLLSYVLYTQKQTPQITEIKPFTLKKFLSLDPATIRNLEIFESYYTKDKSFTLFGVLNKCRTAMGKRFLRKILLQPLKSKKEIEKRLQAVDFFTKKQNLLEKVREILYKIYDLEKTTSKICSNLHQPQDFINLKISLKQAFEIKELLKGTKDSLLQNLISKIDENLKNLQVKIEITLVDNPQEAGEGNLIKKGVSQRLDELKELTLNTKGWLLEFEKKEKEKTKIPTLKVGYNKVFGYYIEITKPYVKQVPKEYIRKQTLVNSERYITLELKEMEEKILSAEEEILKEEKRILDELREEVIKQRKKLQNLSNSLAFLDVLTNFSFLALQNNYTKPEFTNKKKIEIKNGRHPVVEKTVGPENFVKNDTFLDKNNQQILIITGPNMAGKSVYIRQVALISLLAHIGCFVPAEKATLPILDKIAVRSGAGDIIAQGLSTFMVEMVETAAILNSITDNSLVVLDEIGRGTSTYDGISIAWAVAEYLAKTKGKKAFSLFATHYHELQSLEEQNKNIKNFHMHVKNIDGKLIFTYKLQKGASSHSFGIHVAKLSGLPEEVIKRANEILEILEGKTKNVGPRKIVLTQQSLFSNLMKAEDHPAIKKLKELDLDKITPIQALNELYKLKEML